MAMIYPSLITSFRAQTFRTAPGLRLSSAEEAVAFVNERGFVAFWPITGIVIPSIWKAVAGDRPVPDEHDDPGHITWDWKDRLLGKGVWYYGRCIRKRNTMISLSLLPYFYALSPNYGDPEQDYLIEYEQGLMASEAKQVYEALLREGALDTINLRKAARVTNESHFNKAMEALQVAFRVMPVGVSDNGAWHYSFIYDCTHRHLPNLVAQARDISEHEARRRLVLSYLQSVGAVPESEIERVFRWNKPDIQLTLKSLLRNETITKIQVVDQISEWLALPGILS
jgi:hypothetical protein